MKDVNMCIILFIYILGVFCLDFIYCYLKMPFQRTICYYCKKPGHKQYNCWSFRAAKKPQFCLYCKKVGHEVTDCFYLRRKESNSEKKNFKPNDTEFPRNKVIFY